MHHAASASAMSPTTVVNPVVSLSSSSAAAAAAAQTTVAGVLLQQVHISGRTSNSPAVTPPLTPSPALLTATASATTNGSGGGGGGGDLRSLVIATPVQQVITLIPVVSGGDKVLEQRTLVEKATPTPQESRTATAESTGVTRSNNLSSAQLTAMHAGTAGAFAGFVQLNHSVLPFVSHPSTLAGYSCMRGAEPTHSHAYDYVSLEHLQMCGLLAIEIYQVRFKKNFDSQPFFINIAYSYLSRNIVDT